jgi:hypothetical protein
MKTYLSIIILNSDFLLANCAPELNSQLRNIFLIALHAHNRKPKESLLHIEAHQIIVQRHDSVQAPKSPLLYPRIRSLCGLADNLHNIISLALILEVAIHKLQRVSKSINGCQTDLWIRLLFSGTLYDRSQNSIRVLNKTASQLRILRFANEPNSSQAALLQMITTLTNISHQARHQLRPLIARQLNRSYRRRNLSRSLPSLRVARRKGLKRQILDLLLGIDVQLDPFLLQLV